MYDLKKKRNYNFAPANASHTKPWHNVVHMGEPLKMLPELNNLTQIVECLQLYGNPGYVVSPSMPQFTNSPMGGNSDHSIILHHEVKSPIHPAHGYHFHILCSSWEQP